MEARFLSEWHRNRSLHRFLMLCFFASAITCSFPFLIFLFDLNFATKLSILKSGKSHFPKSKPNDTNLDWFALSFISRTETTSSFIETFCHVMRLTSLNLRPEIAAITTHRVSFSRPAFSSFFNKVTMSTSFGRSRLEISWILALLCGEDSSLFWRIL